ncbi:hypothetical protein [Nitrosopumilus sp.]|uniref:hypothetical protein n=1 Tax=Nitrosopumilus sp. TaxID=2024843 RepID=UPI002931F4FD|nr:hypothetical protein [Nitrosopumilus sp.]
MKNKKKKETGDKIKIYHLTCKTCKNKIISVYPDDDQCGTCSIKAKEKEKTRRRAENTKTSKR